jgi:peroxiredoxin family protein
VNSQVQYLQKQIQRRDAQIQALIAVLQDVERETQTLESVACAFAWDLAKYQEDRDTADSLGIDWDEALKAAEEARS